MKDQSETNNNRLNWLLVIAVLSVFSYLFIIQGYSAGYGQMVDGKVSLAKSSLAKNMVDDFAKDGGEWNFGYVVPIAVLALVFMKRRELMSIPVEPSNYSGFLVLLFGFFIYWVGYLGEQKYFGYAAGQILILGSVLWFFGWHFFKNIYWLWFLIGMMWPWRFLIDKISSPLQLLMAKCTAGFLNLIGAGAVQNGSAVITSQRDKVNNVPISLDIDVACSGMRSLFALIMIGLIVASFSIKVDWKRWVFILFVPVLAIIGNFVRMLMLYFGNLFFGAEFAIGKSEFDPSGYHICAGLVVFIVAIYLMMLLVDLLNNGTTNLWFSKNRKVVVKKK